MYQIRQGGVLAHDEADPCGRDQLLPMTITDCRVLELTYGPQRRQHVLDRHLKTHERVPRSHVLVQASYVLNMLRYIVL